MLENIKNTIKNFDLKVKKIMVNGLRFSLIVALIGTLILSYYISVFPSNSIYYIGKEIVHLSISFAASFLVSAFAIDRIKKDLS